MTPQEFLTKIDSLDLPKDLLKDIHAKLSRDKVTHQDLLEVQGLIADSLDDDFKKFDVKVDIEDQPEIKEAYDNMNDALEKIEDEYVENIATVKVVSDYLKDAADQAGVATEDVRKEELRKEIQG